LSHPLASGPDRGRCRRKVASAAVTKILVMPA
jgi:hypothetical protein